MFVRASTRTGTVTVYPRGLVAKSQVRGRFRWPRPRRHRVRQLHGPRDADTEPTLLSRRHMQQTKTPGQLTSPGALGFVFTDPACRSARDRVNWCAKTVRSRAVPSYQSSARDAAARGISPASPRAVRP